MTVTIGRRELLAALGGAVAWPLAARAQQPDWVRRIGVLMGLSESDPEAQSRIAAFRKTLQDLGWTEGRNVRTAGALIRSPRPRGQATSAAP
jgi:putative tryptophan/tyrosine transport system substrate-binding protein